MITLEVLIPNVSQVKILEEWGEFYRVEPMGLSDRSPSLWRDLILSYDERVIIHFVDRAFRGSEGQRWLYEDVDEKDWERFSFKSSLSQKFLETIRVLVDLYGDSGIYLMSDAQFGPEKFLYQDSSYVRFESIYRKFGIKVNSCMKIIKR